MCKHVSVLLQENALLPPILVQLVPMREHGLLKLTIHSPHLHWELCDHVVFAGKAKDCHPQAVREMHLLRKVAMTAFRISQTSV